MSLNSNGSAMHMAFTVMTIAQMYQLEFDITKMIYLAITATFVSLANAVVPGAGLVSLAVIVPQMGLPSLAVIVPQMGLPVSTILQASNGLLACYEQFLNVNSDVYSAILVAKSVDDELTILSLTVAISSEKGRKCKDEEKITCFLSRLMIKSKRNGRNGCRYTGKIKKLMKQN